MWLSRTEIWWKSKIMLYGYKQFVCKKADDMYNDNAEDAGTRFDTSNYELDGPMPKGKIK